MHPHPKALRIHHDRKIKYGMGGNINMHVPYSAKNSNLEINNLS